VTSRFFSLLGILALFLAGQSPGQSLKLEKNLTVPPDSEVMFSVISRKGDFIAAACKDGRVRVWAFPSGEPKHSFDLTDQPISAMSFSDDGSLLAVGGERGAGKIWAIPSGKLKLEFTVGAAIRALAVSPDRSLLAIARAEMPAELWDLSVGRLITELPAKFSGSLAVAFSPDGQRLVSADADTEIRFYEAQTGALRATNSDILLETFAVAFSPDSKSLYVGGADKTVTALDPASGKSVRAFPKQSFVVGDLQVSRDGRSIAAAYFDENNFRNPAPVLVWDAAAATVRTTILQKEFTANGGQFLNDGRLLLTSSATGMLQVWSVH
jgi:WD40 repeat protein